MLCGLLRFLVFTEKYEKNYKTEWLAGVTSRDRGVGELWRHPQLYHTGGKATIANDSTGRELHHTQAHQNKT